MISDLRKLPILPPEIVEVIRQAFRRNEDTRDLTALVERTPSLAKNLLKVVNSPAFGSGSGIKSLEKAVSAIGPCAIRALALTLSLGEHFIQTPFGNILDAGRFYIHSLATGVLMKKTALSMRADQTEQLYLIGLLHDLGKLALDTISKSKYRDVLDLVEQGKSYAEAERELFDRDHRQVWNMLASSWGFPSEMVGMNHGVLAPRMNLEIQKFVDNASMMADALGYMITHPVSRQNRKELDIFYTLGDEAMLEIGRSSRLEIEVIGSLLDLPLPGEAQIKETLLRSAMQLSQTNAKYIITHKDLESRFEGLEELTRVFTGIIRTLDDESLAFSVLEAVIEGFQLDGAFLLNSTKTGGLAGYAARITSTGEADVKRLEFDKDRISPYIRKCIECRKPVRINNPMSEDILQECLDTVTLVWLSPIFVRGHFTTLLGLGVKEKANHKVNTDDFKKILRIVSGEVGLSIENTQLYQRMQKKASTDPLTLLSNRRAIMQILSAEFARFRRKQMPLSVAIFDLDNFKAFNDRYGHLAGDKLLAKASRVLKKGLRASDFIGRYGGDEFIAIFPDTPPEEALEIAERIRQDLCKCSIRIDGVKGNDKLCVSVGVAGASEEMSRPDEVILLADRALYMAKESGRNTCTVYGMASPSQ